MSIAVLGAGIQGVCVALELALLGFEVDLFEQEARPFRAGKRVQSKAKSILASYTQWTDR